MSDVVERQLKREDYLVALYDLSDGSSMQQPTHREVAEASGIDESEIMTVGQTVCDQGLAEFRSFGGLDGNVSITATGVQQAERIVLDRERGGRPRIAGVVLVSDVNLIRELESLLGRIQAELEQLTGLPKESQIDVEADLASARDQLRAPHPNRGVIRAVLSRIRGHWASIVVGTSTFVPAIDIVLRRLGY